MPRIHALPPSVIAAIAAGEVAERPATIIKELIENALDAQATQISIYLEDEKIIVSDNGSGMDEIDLALSIQRHTTSKIQTAEDLLRVQSFGFRGEALASIGSVSRLTIQSKTAEQTAGQELVVQFGQMVSQKPIAAPNGTTVIIENLFYQTPALLKFLKKPHIELRFITEAVTTAALSHPEVSFVLSKQKKVVLQTAQNQTLPQRLATLFGPEMASHFLPIQINQPSFQLSGLLGAPQLARQTKTHQFLFVNQRPISHSPLTQRIKDAYGSLLAPRSQPTFILQFVLAPASVDINVHPRKETVKFFDEARLLQLIQQSIEEVLLAKNLTYRAQQPNLSWQLQEPPTAYTPFSRQASDLTHDLLRQSAEPWKFTESVEQTPIFQLHNTYLVMQTDEGMIMIDQHAAHERILYEQYKQELEKTDSTGGSASYQLPHPLLLRFSQADYQTLEAHFSTLTQIGFTTEPFGENTLRVTSVPPSLKDRNLQRLFNEFIDDLIQEKPIKSVDSLAHRTLAYLACRNAIQAGDPLTLEQRQELLEKLNQTPNRYTCPHGRPTTVTWEKKDLEKLFKRR
jgi:DNA mismatch repair protein MutL